MARGKGTANLAASLEVLAGAPLDARDICPTVADLYVASNWTYKYIGMKTTVQATGDTYRLVNLDVTQESSWVLDGGSGGGGHTIEGDGTAVTDRDTLNFKDMSVSDDSQNEKTDVKPHRLTQSELADIISPLPFFDFSNPGAEAFIFSTNERIIGQWIDGKPLYQKSFATTLSNDDQTSISMGASIDKYIDINVIQYSSGYFRPLTLITNDLTKYVKISAANINAGQYANTLYIRNTEPNYYGTDVIVTARYTKTTDSAVATGEKIVGQWIDGKPLYQKTFISDFTNLAVGSRTWITVANISDNNISEVVDYTGFISFNNAGKYSLNNYMLETFSGVTYSNPAYSDLVIGTNVNVLIKQNYINGNASGQIKATLQYTET